MVFIDSDSTNHVALNLTKNKSAVISCVYSCYVYSLCTLRNLCCLCIVYAYITQNSQEIRVPVCLSKIGCSSLFDPWNCQGRWATQYLCKLCNFHALLCTTYEQFYAVFMSNLCMIYAIYAVLCSFMQCLRIIYAVFMRYYALLMQYWCGVYAVFMQFWYRILYSIRCHTIKILHTISHDHIIYNTTNDIHRNSSYHHNSSYDDNSSYYDYWIVQWRERYHTSIPHVISYCDICMISHAISCMI